MPPKKIIIDTDPGLVFHHDCKSVWYVVDLALTRVDDVLALLLAFSASPEELQIPLVSLCFGNVDV